MSLSGSDDSRKTGRGAAPLFEDLKGRSSSVSLARFFFMNLRLMVSIVIAVTALCTIAVYLSPGTYSSTGVLLVERGKSPTFRSDPIRYELEVSEAMNSEIGIIKSRAVVEAVVDRLGLHKRPRKNTFPVRTIEGIRNTLDALGLSKKMDARGRWIRKISKRLKAEQKPGSSLLVIKYRSDDPKHSAEVARAVTDVYLERHREIYRDISADFFEARVNEAEEQLREALEQISRETNQVALARLQLEKGALEETYRFFRDRWDRAKADQAGDVSLVNVRLVDYPNLPARPDLSRLVSIILTLVGSAVFSVAVALVWEYFDHTVYAPGDITAHVDVPVIGSVRRVRSVPAPPRSKT